MKVLKFALIFTVLLLSVLVYVYARPVWVPMYQKVVGKQTVDQVITTYQKDAHKRLSPYFEQAGIEYPPKQINLLAIKDEKRLELWASNDEEIRYIRSYPILAASGILGPKRREGDKQVPEGIYKLEYLNPNSAYHLSMKLNYPNQFDLTHANAEGRTEPGTNIFIHGKAVSIGCLAMGDSVIEELFVLTALIGKGEVTVAIAPSDPRKTSLDSFAEGKPAWVKELYAKLTKHFMTF